MGMSYLITHTGRRFDLRMPRASEVDIEDIAHSLAHLCRFNGHTRDFYSVAQHSFFVSGVVPPEHALVGLLHDATEAYVGDLISPIKRMVPRYQRLEAEVWTAIAARFGLSLALPREVAEADELLLATEIRDLLTPCIAPLWLERVGELPAPMPGSITALGPVEAKRLFLARYRELVAGHSDSVRA